MEKYALVHLGHIVKGVMQLIKLPIIWVSNVEVSTLRRTDIRIRVSLHPRRNGDLGSLARVVHHHFSHLEDMADRARVDTDTDLVIYRIYIS